MKVMKRCTGGDDGRTRSMREKGDVFLQSTTITTYFLSVSFRFPHFRCYHNRGRGGMGTGLPSFVIFLQYSSLSNEKYKTRTTRFKSRGRIHIDAHGVYQYHRRCRKIF